MIQFHAFEVSVILKKERKQKIKRYKTNKHIKAEKVRVIHDGENLGVKTRDEALKLAQEKGLDLVQISPKAKPPVTKILDFKKFLFEKKKEQKKAKKKSKGGELKELRFSPNIDDHDLNVRIKKAREFLENNNKVRFSILFRGRENVHPELGENKLNKVAEELEDVGRIEKPPLKKGAFMNMMMVPN